MGVMTELEKKGCPEVCDWVKKQGPDVKELVCKSKEVSCRAKEEAEWPVHKCHPPEINITAPVVQPDAMCRRLPQAFCQAAIKKFFKFCYYAQPTRTPEHYIPGFCESTYPPIQFSGATEMADCGTILDRIFTITEPANPCTAAMAGGCDSGAADKFAAAICGSGPPPPPVPCNEVPAHLIPVYRAAPTLCTTYEC